MTAFSSTTLTYTSSGWLYANISCSILTYQFMILRVRKNYLPLHTVLVNKLW